MTITTNTLGSNSAELVIQGPETIANVGAAVETFLVAHGWNLMPSVATTTTAMASTTASAVSASGNIITVTSSSAFAVGMPVQFTGTTFGGIATATTYFILTIPDSTHVTIAATSPIQNAGVTSVALVASATGTLTMACPYAGIPGNTTNNKCRVYWAHCLTGQVFKFIRLNFADLSIDTAQYFTGAAQSADFPTGTNTAYRINWIQHFSYPLQSYLNTATTTTAGANQITTSAGWVVTQTSSSTAGIIATATNSTSAYNVSDLPMYGSTGGTGGYGGGLPAVLYSPSSSNYAYTSVNTYLNATGAVTWNNIVHATSSATPISDWTVLWPTMLQYNNSSSPAYVYISATARSVCIQTKNVDGQWIDWTAVTELENPLGVDNGTTVGKTAWGLTTGMMSANTGVVIRAGATGLGFETNATGNNLGYGVPLTGTSSATIGRADLSLAGGLVSFIAAGSPSYTAPLTAALISGTHTATDQNSLHARFNIFTGPYSTPTTPGGGRTGVYIPQTSKVITALGEAGFLGTLRSRLNFQGTYATATNGSTKFDIYSTTHFRGMGDVMSTQTTTRGTASGKHFALTPTIMFDVSNETSTANLLNNYTIDNIQPAQTPRTDSGLTGLTGNQKGMTQYRTLQPSPMGRAYGIKYVTTGLGPLNTMAISTDANGFASSSGSSTNHIVFNYPSSYNSPDLNNSIGQTTSNLALYYLKPEGFKDDATVQGNIRTSQSVSIAFPK